MNEETMIMPPVAEKNDTTSANPTETPASATTEKKVTDSTEQPNKSATNKSTHRTAATVAAGVFGGVAGGAASAAASTLLNNQDEEVEEETETEETADVQSASPAPAKTEEIKPTDTKIEEQDYTNNGGADPVSPEPTPASNEDNDVQILGVYEREVDGVHQEMAVVTDGETIAAVVDTDGNGEANVIGVDSNHNGQFEDNEIHDISGEHVRMDTYEQAYVAQNGQGADPNVATTSSSSSSDDDVQILGVYEREVDGVRQEMVVVTDGEDVAAVLDLDGDGRGDVLVSDTNHSGTIEENEVIDISNQSIGMNSLEQQYLAQQEEMQMQEQETFAYNASDDQDYNNDVEYYDA